MPYHPCYRPDWRQIVFLASRSHLAHLPRVLILPFLTSSHAWDSFYFSSIIFYAMGPFSIKHPVALSAWRSMPSADHRHPVDESGGGPVDTDWVFFWPCARIQRVRIKIQDLNRPDVVMTRSDKDLAGGEEAWKWLAGNMRDGQRHNLFMKTNLFFQIIFALA